jgi:hypothetical protein
LGKNAVAATASLALLFAVCFSLSGIQMAAFTDPTWDFNVTYNNTVFSVTVSIPQRSIEVGSQKVPIEFYITGAGQINSSSVSVISDADNLATGTFQFEGMFFSNESGVPFELYHGYENFYAFANYIHEDQGMSNVVHGFVTGSLIKSPIIDISGNINLYTTNMAPGTYRVKVILTAETNGTFSVYEDYVEYEIISWWSAHPEWVFVLTIVLSFIVGMATTYLASRISSNKGENVAELKSKKSH